MGVRLDQYVMVAAPVPRHLYAKPNPCAPQYDTSVAGFYEAWEHHQIEAWKSQVGKIGMLYDGMSLSYCWWGAVLAHKTCHWKDTQPLSMPPVSADNLREVELRVSAGFVRNFPTVSLLEAELGTRLRLINHWH